MRTYDDLGTIIIDLADDALRPPERLTVSQTAAKYRRLNNPGSYVGPWLNEMVPYMVEPMEMLTSREHDSMVFVGPAQCAKTDLWLNWLTHSVIVDPMDMILYEKSQVAARDFSYRRLDRLHRSTPEVHDRLIGSQGDNVFDKRYSSGAYVTLSWPSIAELSGRPVPRVWLSDYDRMPMDVDGEGSPFDLARKRTTTFGMNAMTVVESSPGFIVENPKWVRGSPHEAPPCPGALSIYNRGDRRRWYWQCPACGNWFEPDFSLIKYDTASARRDVLAVAERAMMLCPAKGCGVYITPDQKPTINRAGRWVKDGQWLDRDGVLHGEPATRSKTASFWLKGPAAAFATWTTLVLRYIQAEQEFERTGEQHALKSVVNTDLGEPYYLRGNDISRTADQMKLLSEQRSDDDGPHVPAWVRFLIATVDVQKNRFVVQVHGIGPRRGGFRVTVIDYFDIVKSDRLDDQDEHLWVKPAAYPEDWDKLTELVLRRTYPLEGVSGTMGVAWMGYDSGGREGVTNNAYEYWRRLKRTPGGFHVRTFPLKGEASPNAPRVALSYPDSRRKDRNARARGEIPVLMFNPNLLKDGLAGMIDRAAEVSAGAGDDPTAANRVERSFTWPDYLPERWYGEICAEIRTNKGWECAVHVRNEAWDLAYYCLGICLHLKIDRFNWTTPPEYGRKWQTNPFVILGKPPSTDNNMQNDVVDRENVGYSDLSKVAASLA